MSDVCTAYRERLKARGYTYKSRHSQCRVIKGDIKYVLEVTGPDGKVHTFKSTNRLYPAYIGACMTLTGACPGDDEPRPEPMPQLLG